jgi:cob(I)alamin adenosyltransferase
MVVLTKIYTRTGDDGTTALGDGTRLPKYDPRVAAYGTVDETNAAIGLARNALADEDAVLDQTLGRIQNDLFDLGADLCVPDRGQALAYEPLRVTSAQVDWLESEIDRMNAELKPLTSFVLPGGTAAASALHLARTICRRAERHIVELAMQENEPVSEPVMKYMNRLSDLLFVAGRYNNAKSDGDVLWRPGQNR